MDPSKLLAYNVADHTDAPMDTGGEKPDLGDRYTTPTPPHHLSFFVNASGRGCRPLNLFYCTDIASPVRCKF